MSDLNPVCAEGLEIVGFNGAPLVECGRSLPVVRRKSDGMHCVLNSVEAGSPLAWYSEDEAAVFARSGRWTRLHAPLPLPRSCTSESGGRISGQPMVVYAAQPFLDTVGQVAWPARLSDEVILWHPLEQHDESIRAACGSAAAVEGLLDDWATSLKRRFDAMHQQGQERQSLKRVADFMLCAAKNRALRWQAYLRFAMVQEPERVRQTFDAFVRHEFPDMPWQAYLDAISNLAGVLRSVPTTPSRPVPPPTTVTTLSKLHGIAVRPPVDLKKSAA